MIFSKPIVVLDLETNLITSRKPFPEPLECGAIKLDTLLDPIDRFHTFIKQPNVDPLLNEVTPISIDEINSGICEFEFLKKISKFCAGCYLCTFNLVFDLGVLKTAAARSNFELYIGRSVLDLKSISHFIADVWGMKVQKSSLGGFYERFLEEKLEQTHKSMDDVEAAIKILKYLAEKNG